MSATYRWYRIGLPKEVSNLESALEKSPLTTNSAFGFVALDSEDHGPKFRYMWRTKVIITRFDEDGIPYNEEVASVSFIDMGIVRRGPATYLRLENPGHGGRSLFNALETIVGMGFTCEPAGFHFANPLEIFKGVDTAKLTRLSVSGAVVRQDLVARLEFASKNGMDVEGIRLLKGLEYKIDLSSFDIAFRGLRGHATLSFGGAVKISGPLSPMLMTLVERYITNPRKASV